MLYLRVNFSMIPTATSPPRHAALEQLQQAMNRRRFLIGPRAAAGAADRHRNAADEGRDDRLQMTGDSG